VVSAGNVVITRGLATRKDPDFQPARPAASPSFGMTGKPDPKGSSSPAPGKCTREKTPPVGCCLFFERIAAGRLCCHNIRYGDDSRSIGNCVSSTIQAGRLETAQQIYRQILAAEPNQADALHLLGLIAYQVGKYAVAIDYIGRRFG